MTYRDDDAALRTYHGFLVQELSRLEAKTAELAGVQADRDRIAAELSRVRTDLDHTRARRSPVRLESLRVASPCKEPWDKMTGDERVRDCARCEKPVFNLSDMTRAEAEDLLAQRGITACVRFFRRADGTVMTSDCPVGAKKQRRAVAIAAGVLASAAAGAGIAASASGGGGVIVDSIIDVPIHEPVQGGISMYEPAPEPRPVEIEGKVAFDPEPVRIEMLGGVGDDDPTPPPPAPKSRK
jgi:hypothetical protein